MTTSQWVAVTATALCASAIVVALVPKVRDHVRRWAVVYAAVVLAWAATLFKSKGKTKEESEPGAPNLSSQTGALDNIAAAGASRDAQSEQKMNAAIADSRAESAKSAATLASVEEIEDTDERLKTLAELVNGRK